MIGGHLVGQQNMLLSHKRDGREAFYELHFHLCQGAIYADVNKSSLMNARSGAVLNESHSSVGVVIG